MKKQIYLFLLILFVLFVATPTYANHKNQISLQSSNFLLEDKILNIHSNSQISCAVTQEHELYCFSKNSSEKNFNIADKNKDDFIKGISQIKDVCVGKEHICALGDNGEIYCAGDNSFGQLGNNIVKNTKNFINVFSDGDANIVKDVNSISCGDYHTCLTKKNGSEIQAFCWGKNESGQLGIGNTQSSFIPKKIQGIDDILALKASGEHTCIKTSSNHLYCFGNNSYGQIGNGTKQNSFIPAKIDIKNKNAMSLAIKDFALGQNHTCAIVDEEKENLYCWGKNIDGEIGNNSGFDETLPKKVYGIQNIANISLGDTFSCAMTSNNQLYCFGKKEGEANFNTKFPVLIDNVNNLKEISCSGKNIFAKKNDGNLSCLGNACNLNAILLSNSEIFDKGKLYTGKRKVCYSAKNTNLACPRNINKNDTSFSMIEDKRDFVDTQLIHVAKATHGSNFGCALVYEGTVFCWGDNQKGQIGNGTNLFQSTPTKVCTGYSSNLKKCTSYLRNVVDISSGDTHSCAVTKDGKVYCWGGNEYLQLGIQGNEYYKTLALPIGDIIDAKQISCSKAHTCYTSLNGVVSCWGANEIGQCGVNNNSDGETNDEGEGNSTFVQTPTALFDIDEIKSVSCGNYFTCGISEENEGYCWGATPLLNQNGESTSTPTKVDELKDVQEIASYDFNVCIKKVDNEIYCTNYNLNGEKNNLIPNDKNFVKINPESLDSSKLTSKNYSCMMSRDEKIYCFNKDEENIERAFNKLFKGTLQYVFFAGQKKDIPITNLQQSSIKINKDCKMILEKSVKVENEKKEENSLPSLIFTATASFTNTPTRMPSNTFTSTLTMTPTMTSTSTKTKVATRTFTNTPTNTLTYTPTNTLTHTLTNTATREIIVKATNTHTRTQTPTFTKTSIPTKKATNTKTATFTSTKTPTVTATRTPTLTNTKIATATASKIPTNTKTFTATVTQTKTPTFTFTNTQTFTPTKTKTSTPTKKATSTMTATKTSTSTPTATSTFTPTSTSTLTPTPTFTATQTLTNTPTKKIKPSKTIYVAEGQKYEEDDEIYQRKVVTPETILEPAKVTKQGGGEILIECQYFDGASFIEGREDIKANLAYYIEVVDADKKTEKVLSIKNEKTYKIKGNSKGKIEIRYQAVIRKDGVIKKTKMSESVFIDM